MHLERQRPCCPIDAAHMSYMVLVESLGGRERRPVTPSSNHFSKPHKCRRPVKESEMYSASQEPKQRIRLDQEYSCGWYFREAVVVTIDGGVVCNQENPSADPTGLIYLKTHIEFVTGIQTRDMRTK